MAFHSDEEKWAARERYLQSLAPAMANLPFQKARKLVRPYQSKTTHLVDGDVVIETVAEPSASGFGASDIPTGIPAYERSDDRIPPTAPRRGGRKATKKALLTRAQKTGRKAKRGAGPVPPRIDSGKSTPTGPSWPNAYQVEATYRVQDAENLLAALAADLD